MNIQNNRQFGFNTKVARALTNGYQLFFISTKNKGAIQTNLDQVSFFSRQVGSWEHLGKPSCRYLRTYEKHLWVLRLLQLQLLLLLLLLLLVLVVLLVVLLVRIIFSGTIFINQSFWSFCHFPNGVWNLAPHTIHWLSIIFGPAKWL